VGSLPYSRKFQRILCVVLLCFYGSLAQAQEVLTVAVASSFYEQAKQYKKQFEAIYNVNIRLVSGSTGRLYNQIQQGAPFDVLIAADLERPALLIQSHKAETSFTVAEAYFGLLLDKHYTTDLNLLLAPNIRHIAIANPNVAPLGKISQTLLKKSNLWKVLKPKFVYAQNALQVASMVKDGLVDAGFVPVDSPDLSLALIQYQGLSLTQKTSADLWLQFIIASTAAPKFKRKPHA